MLEDKIDRLNENLEHLNTLLEAMANASKQPQSEVVEVKAEAEVTTEKQESEKAFAHDDIKSMALKVVRSDRSMKDKIKEKLSEHDAKVATDLSEDATQVVGAWLSDLVNEVPF